MKTEFSRLIMAALLLCTPVLCVSQDSVNLILLPDTFGCHQIGAEAGVSKNNSLGILATIQCASDRPTYGSSNSAVDNTFSRVLVPWRYSPGGRFHDGYFIQGMIGTEKSEFRSDAGSSANVTFIDIGLYGGYQWFWDNGFNVSVLGGVAYLMQNSLDKNIVPGENSGVIDFLNKNTDTNTHPGGGVVLGWKF